MSTRKSLYGITPDQLSAIAATQDGKCAICKLPPERSRLWHVDHDHATGQVRGLLCGQCNTGLGLFRDSPERLDAAAIYLRRTLSVPAAELKQAYAAAYATQKLLDESSPDIEKWFLSEIARTPQADA